MSKTAYVSIPIISSQKARMKAQCAQICAKAREQLGEDVEAMPESWQSEFTGELGKDVATHAGIISRADVVCFGSGWQRSQLQRMDYYMAMEMGKMVVQPDVIKLDALMGIDTSDGFYSFRDLYTEREMLFFSLCKHHADIAWKSRWLADGTMPCGMFIVGLNTPVGIAAQYYPVDPFWNMIKIKEVEYAPQLDDKAIRESAYRMLALG